MKKTFYFLVLLAIVNLLNLTSCDLQKDRISVEIEGLGNDTILVQYSPIDENIIRIPPKADTIFAVEGKFTYNLPTDSSYIVFINPMKLAINRIKNKQFLSDSRTIFLLLANGEKAKVRGKVEDKFLDYNTKGSESSRLFAIQRIKDMGTRIKADSVEILRNYYEMSPEAPPHQDSLIKVLFDESVQFNNMIKDSRLEFIKKHTDEDISAYLLTHLSIDSFGTYLPTLSPKVRNGLLKPVLDLAEKEYKKHAQFEENIKKIVPGSQAPDFTLKNLSGEDISLSAFKGKYVVLDFWGSWCGWCIHGFPKMKEYYNKYKEKVEFIGIDCRDSDNDWRKAVNEHKLPWIQLTNDENNSMDVTYAIKGYPTKIILDKELKIVSVIIGESEDFYDKLDELLQ